MTDQKQPTKDQTDLIAATLRRIRAGLKRDDVSSLEEPAHIFNPEAVYEKK